MRKLLPFLLSLGLFFLGFALGWFGHDGYIARKYPAVWMPAEFTIKDGEQVSTKSIEYRVRLTGEAR